MAPSWEHPKPTLLRRIFRWFRPFPHETGYGSEHFRRGREAFEKQERKVPGDDFKRAGW